LLRRRAELINVNTTDFQKLLDKFEGDFNNLYLLNYLISLNQKSITTNYQKIKERLNMSIYKQKKSLDYLKERNMINYSKKGQTKDKRIIITLNMKNEDVRYLKEVNSMKKQTLLPFLGQPDKTDELSKHPVMMYSFKINGNNPQTILDYSMQKFLQAKFELIDWDKVTNRDLAGVFMQIGQHHRDLRLYELKKINWAGTVINKMMNSRDCLKKKDFLVIARKFINTYEQEYMNGSGLNWGFIHKHITFRDKILDKIEKELYTKSSSEQAAEMPDFF
jgi:hypothetical protein